MKRTNLLIVGAMTVVGWTGMPGSVFADAGEPLGVTVNGFDVSVGAGEGWTKGETDNLVTLTGSGPYVLSGTPLEYGEAPAAVTVTGLPGDYALNDIVEAKEKVSYHVCNGVVAFWLPDGTYFFTLTRVVDGQEVSLNYWAVVNGENVDWTLPVFWAADFTKPLKTLGETHFDGVSKPENSFLGRFRFGRNCRIFGKLATTEGEETTFVGTGIGL